LTVGYAVGGTAVNGIDYQGLSGSLTFPAYVGSMPITVSPNPTLSTSPSSTVTLTLASGSSYSVGSPNTATVTITNVPTTLYIAQLRPTSGASASTGSGVATILISSDGSLASVSVSYSNLTS